MAGSKARPNILLITTDQQRFDAMGLNCPPSPLQTPCLDELASQGVNFTRAYSTCPVCIPARRTLLSGLHPVTHGLRHYEDGLEWDAPVSLPAMLARAGYQTELVGKLHLHPQRKRYGYQHMVRSDTSHDRWDTPLQPTNDWLDWMRRQGYEFPNDIGVHGNSWIARPWDKAEHLHHSSFLANQAVDFLTRTRDPSCPFFLHLSFTDPHPPLTPPQAYWDRYYRRHDWEPTLSEWTPVFDEIPRGVGTVASRGPFRRQDMRDAAAGYFGLINHVDDRIRFVLTRLFEYGSPRAAEPTIILFTSDHGELLGDHHLWRKSLAYEGSAHIPFFISWRNMNGLVRGSCDALVGLEDICATVLDLCGLPQPEAFGNSLDSQSLAPAVRGEACRPREVLFGECRGPANHYVIHGDAKYIWFPKTGGRATVRPQERPAGKVRPFRRRGVAVAVSRSHRAAPRRSGRLCLQPGCSDPMRESSPESILGIAQSAACSTRWMPLRPA